MTDYNLVTVTEFGLLMPEVNTSGYDAPTISGMIGQASKMVSDYLYYTPIAEDIVDEAQAGLITSEGDLLVFPAKPPIISVSSLSIYRGATSVSITLVNSAGTPKYNIDYTARHLRYPYEEITLQGSPVFTNFYSLRGSRFNTKMSYRGGWEVSQLPSPIKRATCLFVKDMVSGQYNAAGAAELSQGAVTFRFSSKDGASKIVQEANRLLGPYRRVA